MDLPNVAPTNLGIYRQPSISDIQQQQATIGNIGAQTQSTQQQIAGQQQQQAAQRMGMQRALAARNVVAQSVDDSGNIDTDAAVKNLYKSGLSDEAQQLQDHLSKQNLQSAQAQMYQAHGGYFDNGGQQGANAQGKLDLFSAQHHATAIGAIAKESLSTFNDSKISDSDKTKYWEAMKPTLSALGADQSVINRPYDSTIPQMMSGLYKGSDAVKTDIQQQLADTKQQNADTMTQAEKDKSAYQDQYLKNQLALSAVKAQKVRAQLANSGGEALSKLELQEQAESKMALGGRGPEALQDKKVSGAIDSRVALNRYYDPKTGMYNVPQSGYAEITSSLAPLLAVTGGGSGSETQREELQAKTLKGMINNFASWASGDPLNATTQANLKLLANQIDAIGMQSEANRNAYGNQRASKWSSLGVKPDRAKVLATSEGNSYKDFLIQQHQNLGFDLDNRTTNQLYGQGISSNQPPAKNAGNNQPQTPGQNKIIKIGRDAKGNLIIQ